MATNGAGGTLSFMRKYGVQDAFYFPLIDVTTGYFSTAFVHAAGDTKFIKAAVSGGNTTNGFVHIANGIYQITITAVEMQTTLLQVTIVDAGNLWEPLALIVETYGSPSAQHIFDLNLATQPVNVIQIDGATTVGNNATLHLKQLDIQNNAGDAVIAHATGGAGDGLSLLGNAAGHGLNAVGGASNGNAINAQGGAATGVGIAATGGTTGAGVYVLGGSGGGHGIHAAPQAGNNDGVHAEGNGTGHGVSAEGGATGHGIYGLGGATSGDGVHGEGQTSGDGIAGVGAGAGDGVGATGGATGRGIHATGGATSGEGLRAEAQNGGDDGIIGLGEGVGAGVKGIAGATGHGIYGYGGLTSGQGIRGEADTNDSGIRGVKDGTGYDIEGDIQGNLSGTIGDLGATAKASVNAEVDTGLADINLDHFILTDGAVTGSVAVDSFATDLTEASNDHYNDATIQFYTGALAGQSRKIDDYVGGTKVVHVTPDLTEAPGVGDDFIILPSGAGVLSAASVDAIWDENVVTAHGTAQTAGRLVRDLGGNISARTNSGNLNALLGVADTAGHDVPSTTTDEVLDEALSGHTTVGTLGQALQPIRQETAQAGAAGTITLDAGASAIGDFYADNLIITTGGTGANQARAITSYDGGTKVASIAPDWKTNPDATTEFVIIAAGEVAALSPAAVAAAVWAEQEGAEPAVGAIADNATFGAIMQFLKRRFFNRVTQTSTVQTITQDDSATALTSMAVSDDGVTQTKGKVS
jgi:hypothetical protein